MKQISVHTARERLATGNPPQLVDCRETWEWEIGHLPSAIHIPLGEISERANELTPGKPVIVYCHHGVRSISGATLLEREGFTADSMAGGTEAWSEHVDPGLPKY